MASQGKEGYGVSEQRIDCEFKVVLIGDFEIGKCETLVPYERKETEPGTFIVKYETQTLHIEKKSVKANISGIIPTKQYILLFTFLILIHSFSIFFRDCAKQFVYKKHYSLCNSWGFGFKFNENQIVIPI